MLTDLEEIQKMAIESPEDLPPELIAEFKQKGIDFAPGFNYDEVDIYLLSITLALPKLI